MRGLLLEDDLQHWKKYLDQYWVSTVSKFRYYPNTDGRTWHRNIKVLAPGSRIKVGITGSVEVFDFGQVRRSWPDLSPDHKGQMQWAAAQLYHTLAEAIKSRIDLSDVPVGVLLSGGLDSSIIYKVAEMAGRDITTFTIDNEEDQKYVSLLKPKNLKFLKYGKTYKINDVLRANESPVDLGSMIAQNLIGKAVKKEKFVVALSGDGADELFGGYRRINEYDSQASDVWSELVSYHLPRLDKMMMQSTIELRSPYLARDVVELALSLPYEWRKNKNLLKMAFSHILPQEIIDRPKEPLKLESVRIDKTKHSQEMMKKWLKLKKPV
jgi:asparagine synthase (glutamine-hydrolysing)